MSSCKLLCELFNAASTLVSWPNSAAAIIDFALKLSLLVKSKENLRVEKFGTHELDRFKVSWPTNHSWHWSRQSYDSTDSPDSHFDNTQHEVRIWARNSWNHRSLEVVATLLGHTIRGSSQIKLKTTWETNPNSSHRRLNPRRKRTSMKNR